MLMTILSLLDYNSQLWIWRLYSVRLPAHSSIKFFFSEFLLGDSLLVAPVLDEGSVSRDIYLPAGRWQDEVMKDHVYLGPIWLRGYPAPLDTLPYFTKL